MSAVSFENEQEFLTWAQGSPESFVLNLARTNDPRSIVLHRASCGTLRARYAPGALTNRSSRKVGAQAVNDLATWIAANLSPAAGFKTRCGNCRP